MENIPKLIFIVPYRNREHEKRHFSIYMKYIMEDYDQTEFEIYYSHQMDSRPFNRGATKNIGFLAMKEKYPNDYKNITFVFNDIDTIPNSKNLLKYETTKGLVKHFYGFTFTLGGIFSINGEDFENCNGFPNNWGWGLEDNAMNDRVLKNKIIIDRSRFFTILDKSIIHLHDNPNRLVNNNDPGKYKQNKLFDNLININNLKYTIENHSDKLSTNNLSTNINEYMINIEQFFTLLNCKNDKFYSQNISQSNKLYVDKMKREVDVRWKMFK